MIHRPFALSLLSAALAAISPSPAPAIEPIGDAEYRKLADDLDLRRAPWASIPWRTSLTEARQAAATQHKPVFLVVNTGNCLGFV